jgi:hypothetical protein
VGELRPWRRGGGEPSGAGEGSLARACCSGRIRKRNKKGKKIKRKEKKIKKKGAKYLGPDLRVGG